jgi:hypothetical protein
MDDPRKAVACQSTEAIILYVNPAFTASDTPPRPYLVAPPNCQRHDNAAGLREFRVNWQQKKDSSTRSQIRRNIGPGRARLKFSNQPLLFRARPETGVNANGGLQPGDLCYMHS